jgi:hypothetical protein
MVEAFLFQEVAVIAEDLGVPLESLKGKTCCRQVKFYSGVYALAWRWFCLSRILARPLNSAAPRPALSNCRIPLAGLRRGLARSCPRLVVGVYWMLVD